MTEEDMSERLWYIRQILNGNITYASNFGRICTIERAVNPKVKMTREIKEARQLLSKPRSAKARAALASIETQETR